MTRSCGALICVVLALPPGAAFADPPYGTDYDAPETFETAVLVEVTGPNRSHDASFETQGDVDFYKFQVAESGGSIDVQCWEIIADSRQPCASSLMDPDQVPQETNPTTWDYVCGCAWTSHHVLNAKSGEWRLRVTGGAGPDGTPIAYQFRIDATGAPARPDDGGAGSASPLLLLVLGAVSLARHQRRVRGIALALLVAPALAAADPPGGDDYDAPNDPTDAVLIQPSKDTYLGTLGNPLLAGFKTLQDTDAYGFLVTQGQHFEVVCYQASGDLSDRGDYTNVDVAAAVPCVLLDPLGVPVPPTSVEHRQSLGYVTTYHVRNAAAGAWRLVFTGSAYLVDLEVTDGGDRYGWFLEFAWYAFAIRTEGNMSPLGTGAPPGTDPAPDSNKPAGQEGSGSAGSLFPAPLLLLGLMGAARQLARRKRCASLF